MICTRASLICRYCIIARIYFVLLVYLSTTCRYCINFKDILSKFYEKSEYCERTGTNECIGIIFRLFNYGLPSYHTVCGRCTVSAIVLTLKHDVFKPMYQWASSVFDTNVSMHKLCHLSLFHQWNAYTSTQEHTIAAEYIASFH